MHDSDHADHVAHLVRRTALAEGIAVPSIKSVLHGDHDSTLKATTGMAMLNWLAVKPAYSRPRISDDNAYAESLFRTTQYRPEFAAKDLAELDDARTWALSFVHWCSGIRYVSPAQRHAGEDQAILASRHVQHASVRDHYLDARLAGSGSLPDRPQPQFANAGGQFQTGCMPV